MAEYRCRLHVPKAGLSGPGLTLLAVIVGVHVDWLERLRARILISTEIYAGINTKGNIALFPMRLGIYPTGGGK